VVGSQPFRACGLVLDGRDGVWFGTRQQEKDERGFVLADKCGHYKEVKPAPAQAKTRIY
jgi:hypothetical protein